MNCLYLETRPSGGMNCRAAAELAEVPTDLCVIEPATCQQCGRSKESQMVRRLAAMFSVRFGAGKYARQAQEEREREAIKQGERETEQALRDQERSQGREMACPHRGPQVREAPCKPCLGKKLIPVFACNHPEVADNECTLSNHLIRDPSGDHKLPVCAACRFLPDPNSPPNDRLDARGNPIQAHSKSRLEQITRESQTFQVVMTSRPVADAPDITGFVRGKQVGGFVVSAIGANADCLEGIAHGTSVFLTCGGPSLNDIRADLDRMHQRGIAIAAVNQCGATHVRPHYWFSVDEPLKFHPVIWRDPGIMKFVMRRRSRDEPQIKLGHDPATGKARFQKTGIKAREYPNVWFFEHQMGMDPETFLHMTPPSWGGDWQHQGRSRQTKSVMLVAIRMLYWLGFRRIYLVGCDFRMSPERTYAFDEPKDSRASGYNNNSYEILNHWFHDLRPVFERHSLEIINCTPGSGLTAFDSLPLSDAIARESLPPATDVRGYYITGSAGG